MITNNILGEALKKRPYAVVPSRCMSDKALKDADRRVLIGLGYYANRAGVCWPSIRTLVQDTGLGANTIQRAIERLLGGGYVRQLQPNTYNQKHGSWGLSNRYQLLWNPDDPIPSWEQIRGANKLQPKAEQVCLDTEEWGVRGANNDQMQMHIHMQQLASAWAAATEQCVGFRPVQPPAKIALARAATENTSPASVSRATLDLIGRRIKVGLGIPSFDMVIEHLKKLEAEQNNTRSSVM